MSILTKIWAKIRRKWIKLRLQPIRVFCLHHISKEYDPLTMWKCDWVQIDEFKNGIQLLQQSGVEIISLSEAYNHICNDKFRYKKYAVLTFDDGWDTLKNILPWLNEQKIPVTLFLNPAYLLGEDNREKGVSITKEDLDLFLHNTNIEIAPHGWNHQLCTEMSKPEFEKNVKKCVTYLSRYKEYMPFFAYPCGRYRLENDKYLLENNIIPVYMDGMKNYNDSTAIHRVIW